MKNTKHKPLDLLKHHVSGAIERGEKTAIEAVVANHTPGPWFAENGSIFTLHGARHVADMAKRTAFSIEGREGEANARLIAAAPEMLSQLEEAHRMLTILFNQYNKGDALFIREIGQTIAKAKGE